MTDTVEIDADMAYRAWTVLDLVCDGDAFVTYGADYKARDELARALHEDGRLDKGHRAVRELQEA